MSHDARSWSFPLSFWTANIIEAAERAAYYGWFIMLAPFLTSVVGYSDIEAGYIGGCFAALLYLLPFVSGAFADRVGYRRALMLAMALLGGGYLAIGLVPRKGWVLMAMATIMVGGSLVKPIIAGTVARTSDKEHRARAFSLFYMMVNIGAFAGKTLAKPIRSALGLSWLPLFSAAVAAVALVGVALLYRPEETDSVADKDKDKGKDRDKAPPLAEVLRQLRADFAQVLHSGRLIALIIITGGFWIIQSQMYSSMPKFVLRTVGAAASPEWYANVNPTLVVLCVVPLTQLCRRLAPVTSMTIALGLIPLSALAIALLPRYLGAVGPLHPVTVAMVLGIALQGFAECFLTPRYLEYASHLAPKDKEALYMGYAHLNHFLAWLVGYILSGYLLNAFCPNPETLPAAELAAYNAALATAGTSALPAAYAHAHYLWFVFAAIGSCAFVALLVFQLVTRRPASR